MTTSMIAWNSMTRTPMTTFMIAWHCTMRTQPTTSTDIHVSAHCLPAQSFPLVHSFTSSRAHTPWLKMFAPFTSSTWSSSCASLLALDSPFLFPALPHVPYLLPPVLKSVVNLHNSTNESMDSTDEFSLSTGYEPKAHDFYETSVEPCMQLLDSPPLFSNKVSSANPDYDDATLEDMLHQAHRAQAYHFQREVLSVSLSSSMTDRTGRPVGDRPGRLVEQRNQEAQIRTLLDKQKSKFLQTVKLELINTNFKQLEPKKINNFLKDNYCSKIWNYLKLIKEVSLKLKS